jgi:hypothetical protein
MHRTYRLTAALGLIGCCIAAVAASAKDRVPRFAEGTPVVIVGRISSQPRNVAFAHEKKMQVSVGPRAVDFTLHLDDAKIIGPNGHEARISDIQDKWWVRAEGRVMDDSRRIDVTRMRVFSKHRENLKGTAYYRPGLPHGYIIAVAGSRQVYPTPR